jgi:arabinogalactan oligomer / maltooligosaccharide transport system permease protein
MFNVIYLVSGGAPNHATDILVTEAYRWAFEQDRYGYAAAYSVLIFLFLLVWGLFAQRLTRADES